MEYVYVLRSMSDGNFYVGRTSNLRRRLQEHQRGGVRSTTERRPLRFMYAEMSQSIHDASHREKYLKSAWGEALYKTTNKV